MGSADTYLCLGPGWSTTCNTPFRRHKTWVHEGGCATPFIAHWPKGIAARNELRRTPAHVVDLVPTVLDLAGIDFDGLSRIGTRDSRFSGAFDGGGHTISNYLNETGGGLIAWATYEVEIRNVTMRDAVIRGGH